MEEKLIKVLSKMTNIRLRMFYEDYKKIRTFAVHTLTFATKEHREKDNEKVKRFDGILKHYLNNPEYVLLNNINPWVNIVTILTYDAIIEAYVRKRLA